MLLLRQDAASDTLWRAMMVKDEMPYRIVSMPSSLHEHWVAPDYGSPNEAVSSPDFMRPSRLLKLREAIRCTPPDLLDSKRLAMIATVDRRKEEDAHVSTFIAAAKRTHLAAKTGLSIPNSVADRSKKIAAATMTEINMELNTNSSRGPPVDSESLLSNVTPAPSSFFSVYIGNSGSSKLDFILSEARKSCIIPGNTNELILSLDPTIRLSRKILDIFGLAIVLGACLRRVKASWYSISRIWVPNVS